MKRKEQKTDKNKGSWLRQVMRKLALLAVIAGLIPGGAIPVQAFGSKTLNIMHMHTGESASITFSRGGRYDQQALDQLNWMMRDWRNDDAIKMDPRLFDLMYEVYQQSGSRQPIRIVSSYRSPKSNAMLRRRSKAVAEHSQHMLGKAVDFYLTDVSPERIRSIAIKMQNGGVGYYPRANTPFIHIDVAGVRAWPRMTRSQLVSLFPDQRTVHIPADGKPLAGYDEARSMILARGGKVAGETAFADAGRSGKRRSLWATLFGGDEDEEEDVPQPAQRKTMLASRKTPSRVASNDIAPSHVYDDDSSGKSDSPLAFINREQRNTAPDSAPVRVASVATPEVQPRAPAPLPPVRQVATVTNTADGPQMVWQAGAPAQESEGNPFSAVSGTQLALAPQPPRRPEEVLVSGVMTYAPVPPSRPMSEAVIAAAAPDVLKAPIPDTPEETITTASLGGVPFPPSRPGASSRHADVPAIPPVSAAHAAVKPGPVHTATRHAMAYVQQSVPEARPQQPAPRKAAASNFASFSGPVYSGLSTSSFSGPAVKTSGQ